jgi:hypothetical protein
MGKSITRTIKPALIPCFVLLASFWGASAWAQKSSLAVGESIGTGQYLQSPNKAYLAVQQADGNLCIYRGSPTQYQGGALWCHNKVAPGGQFVTVLQTDGNLCTWRGNLRQGTTTWCSNKVLPGAQFVLNQQDDGNLCVYARVEVRLPLGQNINQVKATWCALSALPPPAPPPPPVEQTVTILSGDNQKVQSASIIASNSRFAMFAPLKVSVKDGGTRPLANVAVMFTCQRLAPGYCLMDPNASVTMNTLVVHTDANGVATLDRARDLWNSPTPSSVAVYDSWGPFTVTAQYGSHTATFHLTALPDPWTLSIASGDNQKLPRTTKPGGEFPTADFAPLQVAVKDNAGKPLGGVPVRFICSHPAAMACQIDPIASDTTVMSDGNGIATLQKMAGKSISAYYLDGPVTIGATYGSASTTFHLTVGH